MPSSSPEPSNDSNEDFAEAETLSPGGPPSGLEGTSDISLDDFMRTDSFETPLLGGSDDDEDATLMPDQVAPVGDAPAIDDVFDITGEGTIPPVRPDEDEGGPDGEGDDDDDSEAPTRFNG